MSSFLAFLALSLLYRSVSAETIQAGNSQITYEPQEAWAVGKTAKTTSKGASATISVGGTSLQVIGNVGPNQGAIQIQLDGQFFSIDTSNPTAVSNVVLWSGKALDPHHVFKVVVVQDGNDGQPLEFEKIEFTPDSTGNENAVQQGQSSIFSTFKPGSAAATPPPANNDPPPATTTSKSSSRSSSSSSSSSSSDAAAATATAGSPAQTAGRSSSSGDSRPSSTTTANPALSTTDTSLGDNIPASPAPSGVGESNTGATSSVSVPSNSDSSKSSSTVVVAAVSVPVLSLVLGLSALFGYRRWNATHRRRIEDDERRLSNFFSGGSTLGARGASSVYPNTMREVPATSRRPGSQVSFGGSRPASWYSDSLAGTESAAAPSEYGQRPTTVGRMKSLRGAIQNRVAGAFTRGGRSSEGR